eukprot:gene7963-8160_t
MRLAWFAADIFGWRVALAVFPPFLRGKVAIVTGANAGLGLETTKALLQQGATVVMACRSLEHAQMSREDILCDARNAGPLGRAAERLIPLHLDLEDFASIPQFVADFHALNLPGLHVLVNNAGIHLKPYKRVSCGFERTMASNYFGHWWLTHLLLNDLKQSAPARVVNVASVSEQLGLLALYTAPLHIDDIKGQRLADSGERSYVIAKTMLLMFTRELARRLEGSGMDVMAVHPGIADSTWYLKSDNESYLFSYLVHRARSLLGSWVRVGQPVQTGAISLIYASIAPELTGVASSKQSHGVLDTISRALLGGRLCYYGPSYIWGIAQNWNNVARQLPCNPWCYSKSACEQLYQATAEVAKQVEQELRQEKNLADAPAAYAVNAVGIAA